jgi:hypothetical protein
VTDSIALEKEMRIRICAFLIDEQRSEATEVIAALTGSLTSRFGPKILFKVHALMKESSDMDGVPVLPHSIWPLKITEQNYLGTNEFE